MPLRTLLAGERCRSRLGTELQERRLAAGRYAASTPAMMSKSRNISWT